MTKVRSVYLVLFLLLFSCFFLTYPAYSAGLDIVQGVVGSTATISGLTSGQNFIIQLDGITYSSGIVPTSGSVIFSIPEINGGTHTIVVQSPAGTQVLSGSFTVSPSITITPISGVVGSSVSVTGKGFGLSENNISITYDSTNVATAVTADSKGSWAATFTIPASVGGNHNVGAGGSITTASGVSIIIFTVKPAATLSPTAGNVGTNVTITGSGFPASASGITIGYDNTAIKTGIASDAVGSWTASFAAPSSSLGNHTITISGSTIVSSDLSNVVFAVMPSITVDKESGHSGDTINVTGNGFSQGESSIVITFDGTNIKSGVTADATGHWTAAIIPSGSNGAHSISAYGGITTASSVPVKTFNIAAQITLKPASGNVGDNIIINGNGFGLSKVITVTYGTDSVLSGISSDSTGNFSANFKAPPKQHGDIQVVATDSGGITSSAVFSMDSIAPAVPKILSPKPGDTVGFVGNTRVDFAWNEVTDPSGVTYDLDVSPQSNFNDTMIKQTGLTIAQYKTSDTEALPHGEYYWRVRAVDGAGNASEWTSTALLKAGAITSTTLIIIVVSVIAVILIILRIRAVFFKR